MSIGFGKDPCLRCGFVTCECSYKLVPTGRRGGAEIWRDEQGRWFVGAEFIPKESTSAGYHGAWSGPRAGKRSRCSFCSTWISVGEPIEKLGSDWVHAACAVPSREP